MTKASSYILFAMWFVACQPEPSTWIDLQNDGEIGWDEKEPCTLRFLLNEDTLSVGAAVKCRGGISSKYFKHSFALELDTDLALCGLPPDDDWILNANYIDKTFMRHKLSYDLFRAMGRSNRAATCAYTELALNGEYHGLYVVMEEVNAGMLRMDKSDTGAVLFKDPGVFRDAFGNTDLDYGQKYPKVVDRSLYHSLDDLRHFLDSSDSVTFIEQVWERFDRQNILDLHLLLLLTNNSDGILKNFLLYRHSTEAPWLFAIWDYDHSFGRDGDGERNFLERELNVNRSLLFRRIDQEFGDEYRTALADRWANHRRGALRIDRIEEMILENHIRLKPLVAKNQERWPVDGQGYWDNNNYRQELALLRLFIHKRLEQLDQRFGLDAAG